jgi:hypothetical protein
MHRYTHMQATCWQSVLGTNNGLSFETREIWVRYLHVPLIKGRFKVRSSKGAERESQWHQRRYAKVYPDISKPINPCAATLVSSTASFVLQCTAGQAAILHVLSGGCAGKITSPHFPANATIFGRAFICGPFFLKPLFQCD